MSRIKLLLEIDDIASKMAAQARAGEWGDLPQQQTDIDQLLNQLRQSGDTNIITNVGVNTGVSVNTAYAPAEAASIRRILDNLDVVQEFVAPWLEQVRPLLNTFANTQGR